MRRRSAKPPERFRASPSPEPKHQRLLVPNASEVIEESIDRFVEAYKNHGEWKKFVPEKGGFKGQLCYEPVTLRFRTRVTQGLRPHFREKLIEWCREADLDIMHGSMKISVAGDEMKVRWDTCPAGTDVEPVQSDEDAGYQVADYEDDQADDDQADQIVADRAEYGQSDQASDDQAEGDQADQASDEDYGKQADDQVEDSEGTVDEQPEQAGPSTTRRAVDKKRYSRTHERYMVLDANSNIKCQEPGCKEENTRPGVPACDFLLEFARKGDPQKPTLLQVHDAVMGFKHQVGTYTDILGVFCRCAQHVRPRKEPLIPIRMWTKRKDYTSEICDLCGVPIMVSNDVHHADFLVLCDVCHKNNGAEGSGTAVLARAIETVCSVFAFEAADAKIEVRYQDIGQTYRMRDGKPDDCPTFKNDGVMTVSIQSDDHDYELYVPNEVDGPSHNDPATRAKDAIAMLVAMDATEQMNRTPSGRTKRRTRKMVGFRWGVLEGNVPKAVTAYTAKMWLTCTVWMAIADFYDYKQQVLPVFCSLHFRIDPHPALENANIAFRIDKTPKPPHTGFSNTCWCNHPGGLIAMNRAKYEPDRPRNKSGSRGNGRVLRAVTPGMPSVNDQETHPLMHGRKVKSIPESDWEELFNKHPQGGAWQRFWDSLPRGNTTKCRPSFRA